MKGLFINYPKLRAIAWGKSRELQSALKINSSSVSRKINGKQKLALDELNTIARVIGVDVLDFVEVGEITS